MSPFACLLDFGGCVHLLGPLSPFCLPAWLRCLLLCFHLCVFVALWLTGLVAVFASVGLCPPESSFCLLFPPDIFVYLSFSIFLHFAPFFRICLPVGYKCRSSICDPFVPSYRPTVPLAFDCNSVLACLLIVVWLWRGLAWVGMGVWLLCICRRVCLSLYCNLLRRILALIRLFPHLSSCVSCFCLSLYSPLDVFVTHSICVLPWCRFPHCLLGCEFIRSVCCLQVATGQSCDCMVPPGQTWQAFFSPAEVHSSKAAHRGEEMTFSPLGVLSTAIFCT